jgi:hypothetical protein
VGAVATHGHSTSWCSWRDVVVIELGMAISPESIVSVLKAPYHYHSTIKKYLAYGHIFLQKELHGKAPTQHIMLGFLKMFRNLERNIAKIFF